jgi:hypothetical protein
VAMVARRSVEDHADPTRTTLSAAPHPLNRAFGRSPAGPEAVSRGR